MATKVKSGVSSAEKWDRNASQAASSYAEEAAGSAERWATNAAASADNFRAAIQQSGISDRFRKGVQKAGAAKYARKIQDVAKDRYAPGISAAKTDYQQNVEPFLSTIAGLTLPGRKPRGDPGNLRRVETINVALHAKRLALLGSAA